LAKDRFNAFITVDWQKDVRSPRATARLLTAGRGAQSTS
jgi:hypothetical protein